MRHLLAGVVAALALLLGGGATASPCPAVIYVTVAKDGAVSVDGKPTAYETLAQTLMVLRPTAKYVLYYRDDPRSEPSPALQVRIAGVLDAITALRLPIGLSSRPDFSDTVAPGGKIYRAMACPGQN